MTCDKIILSMCRLKKIIASSLVAASVLALNQIGATAEWKQDSNGWWNLEGSSRSVGWKEIDGKWYYFNSNGYMKIGWLQDCGKWYYLNSSGAMATNTIINGYIIDSNGVWSHTLQNSSLNSDKNKKLSSADNSNFTADEFISSMKTKVDSVKVEDEPSFSDFLPDAKRKVVTIDGEDLYTYIYNSNEEMKKAAASIYSDGEGYIRTLDNGELIPVDNSWYQSCPHFYKKGNIIVQYGGTKENIFYDLNDIFGEQFAGYTKNISIKKVNSKDKKISDVTGIKFDDITKIVFYDGRGKLNKAVILEDKEKIKEFMRYLDNYVINETKNPELVGWIQGAGFYINDKEVMSITFDNPITINGNYYDVTQGSLNFEIIGQFIKSIDPSYDMMAGLE